MTPDTSTKAVERLRRWNEGDTGVPDTYTPDSLKFQRDLRALLAERDAMERRARTYEAANIKIIAERDRLAAEVASLRLTLGGKTFSNDVPEPIGCPLPGACATVAEIVRGREMQAAWLRVIQAENTCGVTGKPCDVVRCGCAAEQEMLIREAAEARDALAGEGRGDD